MVANVRQQQNLTAAAVHHKMNSVGRQTPEVGQKAKQYTVQQSIHQMQQVLPTVQMKNPDIEFKRKKNSSSV
jgi:hypothetical protein